MNIDEADSRGQARSPRPPKKQKIGKMTAELRTKLKFGAYARPPLPSLIELPPPPSDIERAKDSAFNFEPLPNCGPSSPDFISDITNYIPIGCLRVSKDDLQIAQAVWNYQNFWAAMTLPKDIFNNRDSPQIYNQIQETLFRSKILSDYEMLFTHGFIRLEFKTNDDKIGQLRVYLLHNHLVHQEAVKRKREIEKSTKLLLRDVDISKDTWAGSWSVEVPLLRIMPTPDEANSGKVETLLDVYNSLPSPDPRPQGVYDLYSRGCMQMLLQNDVYGLTTTLYPYQRASAATMLEREVCPGRVIDPRLVKLVDQRDEVWYCDPHEGYTNREPRMYEGARGGILAENMGLGKTVICLALILATRDIYSTVPAQFSLGLIPRRPTTGTLLEMAAGALGRQGVPWKTQFALDEDDGYELTATKKAIREQPGHYTHAPFTPSRVSRSLRAPTKAILLSTTTLVVVPSNLIQQWLDEIKKHTKGLKVLALSSNQDVLPSEVDLLEYDILLFTKTRFEKEGKDPENSPLMKIHFKRLIYDEGHTVGNSSAGSQTDSYRLIESLKLTARWIVSGTPTSGLYSTEESSANTTTSHDATKPTNDVSRQGIAYNANSINQSSIDQERKDLMKLGNIARYFLQARPWSPSSDGDIAQWNKYVLQPRHGVKSEGSAACLRATLEAIMIKHRLSDIEKNVVLPPLHQSIVKLEPCLLDKLTLNVFNIMVITNAIASERQDVDYFFHPTQRKSLQSLVSNLREGSFFWSGFEVAHVQSTIDNAQAYIDKQDKSATVADISLLQQVVALGRFIVSNNVFNQICRWHEIPLSVENEFPPNLRRALSLDNSIESPSLIGATMLFNAQRFVHDHSNHSNIVKGLITSSQKSFQNAEKVSESHTARSGRMQDTRGESKVKALAGGVTTGMEFTPIKHNSGLTQQPQQPSVARTSWLKNKNTSSFYAPSSESRAGAMRDDLGDGRKLAMPHSNASNGVAPATEPDDVGKSLHSSRIISTASAKLSYLLDCIVMYQEAEKILVFYESDNVGWYLAQCLECLGIKHLIYSKGLKSDKRARYVVTFNRTETFRVLLMDVSQAAYGLDMSSASRVYFINPVFAPQVEAQAVKRAHRIGQVKPVYVETLVLSGSIEEVIVDRRALISNEEHQKYKSILDDQTVYEWIRHLNLIPMDLEDVADSDQMAALSTPQRVFGHENGARFDTDAEIMEIDQTDESPCPGSNPGRRFKSDLQNLDVVLRGAHGRNSVSVQGLRILFRWSCEIQTFEVPESAFLALALFSNPKDKKDGRARFRVPQQNGTNAHPRSFNNAMGTGRPPPMDPSTLAALTMASSGAKFYATNPLYLAHVVHGRSWAPISDTDLARALANGHTLSEYGPGENPIPHSDQDRLLWMDGRPSTREDIKHMLDPCPGSFYDNIAYNTRSRMQDTNLPALLTTPAIRPGSATSTKNDKAISEPESMLRVRTGKARQLAVSEIDDSANSMTCEASFLPRDPMAMSQPTNEGSISGNRPPSRPMQEPSAKADAVTGSPLLRRMGPAPRPFGEEFGYEYPGSYTRPTQRTPTQDERYARSGPSTMIPPPRVEDDAFVLNSFQFGSRQRPSTYGTQVYDAGGIGEGNVLHTSSYGYRGHVPDRSTAQTQIPARRVELPQSATVQCQPGSYSYMFLPSAVKDYPDSEPQSVDEEDDLYSGDY